METFSDVTFIVKSGLLEHVVALAALLWLCLPGSFPILVTEMETLVGLTVG